MLSITFRAALAIPIFVQLVNAVAYSISSADDIKRSAAQLAYDTMVYYKGNQSGQTPGILPGPPPAGDYYWWEGGALWGTMIDYWHFTGDDTYNDVVTQAMLFQVGPNQDYMPPNGFWGMSAMTAAENNFPNPPADQPQWLALAQAVFNTQADPSRHDDSCNGGLRWQIPLSNNGYNYKNSIANGCFFNLGARLARYTGNTTYAEWAEKSWDWIRGVGFMDANYNIYDGAHVETNCTDINKAQFSYNNGVYLLGAAHMYNYTGGSDVWRDRLEGLLNATINVFFPNDIAYEVACETIMTCTTDMLSFKGYVHRWLAITTQLAPFTHNQIMQVLTVSTEAAINQCTGGSTGRECGFQWHSGTFDNSVGAGQQMNVLGAVSSLLIDSVAAPVTNETGGTSVGNNNAGASSDNFRGSTTEPTTGDKAGASILTILILATAAGTFGWMSTGV
ncbi:Mannan endo-1,6-alpha-mannosidase DCW1 [Cytospora mali]|uniref:Mannan endo-1,6-alpha-mannosidase n=1 Tax=Cytospora mali TaxID=578113 RepID=A0A194WDD1_CYTMA|nr:Mannan endo-1,6-alpha-mannosidase DCW1 [Valsa mali]